jgi:hypothetical protein
MDNRVEVQYFLRRNSSIIRQFFVNHLHGGFGTAGMEIVWPKVLLQLKIMTSMKPKVFISNNGLQAK